MGKIELKTWQKVIFRNYGMVPDERIAKIIGCDVETVKLFAVKLGIEKISYNQDWIEKGFVTVIRNNWDLLSLQQISDLLDISLDDLKKLLVEYDFLNIKLGEKPQTCSVKYAPLNKDEEENLKEICAIVKKNIQEKTSKPFDFYSDYIEPIYLEPKNILIKERFTSAYSAKYSGALLDDELTDYSDDYLQKVASTGMNGIWISDTLRNLAEFTFDKSYSFDFKTRIRNLKKFVERCQKYGLDVYLYLNEPRSLDAEFFNYFPHLRGQLADDGTYCLCTSQKEVIDYLYGAVKSIAENVPALKAVMTITMSENPTHCYSRPWRGHDNKIETDCPYCKNRKPAEVVAEINNIIAKALKDGNGKTKLISNIWGWANFAKSEQDVLDCIKLLDKDIEVLCVSEYNKTFERGGVSGRVDDYSISVVGPSDFAKKVLNYAKENGHKTWAKVQLNNSWECSAVPYIPVFDLMLEHIENLKELGVDGLMTGWSLGGYPGGALSLCNSACGIDKFDDKKWYKETYAGDAVIIKQAVEIFSDAFKEFPFSVDSLYFGGQNLGPGNLWSLEKQNRASTMVCFTFDDYKSWVMPYGLDVYLNQMKRLTDKWSNGLKMLENVCGNTAVKEFVSCAKACYCHFMSAYNLTAFNKFKADCKKNLKVLIELLNSEEKVTRILISIISTDAKIGFEMTNHYYYNENLLLEKLINISELKEKLIFHK